MSEEAPKQKAACREENSRLSAKPQTPTARPDFLARQQAFFWNRVLTDSQAILDELRADHF